MKGKWPFLFGLLLLYAAVSGCSGILTYLGPPKTEVVDGQKHVGDFVNFNYKLTADDDVLLITKTPLCEQLVQKMRVTQKKRRGFYLALLELPFYGLGLFDLLWSYAIVEESRKVEPAGIYFNGSFVPCNGSVPAAGENFAIIDRAGGFELTARSGPEGELDLNIVLPDDFGPAALDLIPEADPTQKLDYNYPADYFLEQ